MLWVLLLLPGLLGATVGPADGPPECAKGSAMWCRDLQAAARCGALEHCQQAVWGQPALRSLACNLCRHAAAAAAGRRLNPEAPGTDVLAAVRKTCGWLSSPESAARCQGMADTHHAAVLSMLGRDTAHGPGQVCTALTLCQPLQGHLATPGSPSLETASELVAPIASDGRLSFHPRPPPVCQDCVRLVARLQEAARANSSLVEGSLQEQCEPLAAGLALLCRSYVHQLSAPAKRTLELLPPKDICRRGGFCEEPTGSAHQAQVAAVDGVPSLELVAPRKTGEVQMKAGLTCEVCLSVIQQLDQWLESNKTEEIIVHTLERVCTIMPSSMVQQCVTLVDTYSPSLVQLMTKVTPEKVCTAIRLCGGRRRRVRSLPLIRPTTPAPLLDDESQGSFCSSCRRLFQESARSLDQRTTKHNILAAFKGGCRILPLPYVLQCNHFVTTYQPMFLESLKSLMDASTLCKKMGACHAPRVSLLGTDQCTLGPSFWCRSPESAALCHAMEHCQHHAWRDRALQAREQA